MRRTQRGAEAQQGECTGTVCQVLFARSNSAGTGKMMSDRSWDSPSQATLAVWWVGEVQGEASSTDASVPETPAGTGTIIRDTVSRTLSLS